MKLAIVILNYRTPALVTDCLASLWPQLADRADRHAIVVDNASPDDSCDIIAQAIESNDWSSGVELVRSPVNGGFAAGNNVGIETAMSRHDPDLILLLNSDTIVRQGAIDAMVDAMTEDASIGALGCRLEWPDGEPQVSGFRARHPLGELINAAGTGLVTRLLRPFDASLPLATEPREVDWVTCACAMFRADALAIVGGLDEGYFMYFEDIDLCRRIREAGWRVDCSPAGRVVHLRGGSSSVKTDASKRQRRPRYYYAARSRYFAKFYGGRLGLGLANICWLLGRAVSKTRELFGRHRHVCDHEAIDIWTNAWNPLTTDPTRTHPPQATPVNRVATA